MKAWLARHVMTFALLTMSVVWAQSAPGKLEREYPFPLGTIENALHQMGAYIGGRLPQLDGFIYTERAQLPHYEHPYYEYKIDLVPESTQKTLVRVRANISAWYEDPETKEAGYEALTSNGRLETDLLDRLNEYFDKNKAKIVTDPDTLAKKLSEVQQEREDAEQRVSELTRELQRVRTETTQAPVAQYVQATKPVSILDRPEESAKLLLHAVPEDEFQVLERRGVWVRVALEGSKSGWLKSSQVTFIAALPGHQTLATEREPRTGEDFTVIREEPSTFSGDWPRLKDKQALYLWAQAEGSTLSQESGKKLHFAEALFRERYREISHSSQLSVDGIVIIFLDRRGGVAAASLDDIAHWFDGSLTQAAFLKRCSLDPPGAFEDLPAGGRRAAP